MKLADFQREPAANEDEPLEHSLGFPFWGPVTLCGEGTAPLACCYVVTCPHCLRIIETRGGIDARAAELTAQIGPPRALPGWFR